MKIHTRKTARSRATRAAVNAIYYARVRRNPVKHDARLKQSREWKRAHRHQIADEKAAYYERNRSEILFTRKLVKMLERVRRAELERGRIPYDG